MPYQYKRESLSSEEAEQLANAAESLQEKLIVFTLLDTDLRVSELAGLEKHNIQWQERKLVIYKSDIYPYGKKSKHRVIPMTERVWRVLELYFTFENTVGMSVRTIQRIVNRIANRAGISKPVNPSVLRRTFSVNYGKKHEDWDHGIQSNFKSMDIGMNIHGNRSNASTILFAGKAEHTVDRDGRVSIPSKMRDVIRWKYDTDNLYLFALPGGFIALYPGEELSVLIKQVVRSERAYTLDEILEIKRVMANAEHCKIDGSGRVLIPSAVRELAHISQDVMILGAEDHIEIWDPAHYRSRGDNESIFLQNMFC